MGIHAAMIGFAEKIHVTNRYRSFFWNEDERYQPWFEQWSHRPEYARRLGQQ